MCKYEEHVGGAVKDKKNKQKSQQASKQKRENGFSLLQELYALARSPSLVISRLLRSWHRFPFDFPPFFPWEWDRADTQPTHSRERSDPLKAGFHRQRSRSWSRKSASDQVKIENRSRKQSHKLDGIGVGRIRTVPFSFNSACHSDAYDPMKTRLSQAKAQEPTNHNVCSHDQASVLIGLFFGFGFRLQQSSFYLMVSDGIVSSIDNLLRYRRLDFHYIVLLIRTITTTSDFVLFFCLWILARICNLNMGKF